MSQYELEMLDGKFKKLEKKQVPFEEKNHKFDKYTVKFLKPLNYIYKNGMKFPTNATIFELANEFLNGHAKLVDVIDDITTSKREGHLLAYNNNKYKHNIKTVFRVNFEVLKDAK